MNIITNYRDYYITYIKQTSMKIVKKYRKLKIWNQSFLLKHKLDTQSYYYIIIFYILNAYTLFKDIKRFHIF